MSAPITNPEFLFWISDLSVHSCSASYFIPLITHLTGQSASRDIMGWWLDKAETQWHCEDKETNTCQHCSWGVTPQQHERHENTCVCCKHIKELTCQQQQKEAEALHQAIANAKHNCAMTTNKCSWLPSKHLSHLFNSSDLVCPFHCMSLLASPNAEPLDCSDPFETMGILLAGMSHNICAPLGLISGRL